MIKNVLTHWRTSLPGFVALVTGTVSLIAMIINHTATQATVIAALTGMFTGLGLLFSQDYTQGAKAHAESQSQIAELQKAANLTPGAIDTGDTTELKRVPMTPATVPPPAIDNTPATPPKSTP